MFSNCQIFFFKSYDATKLVNGHVNKLSLKDINSRMLRVLTIQIIKSWN